MIQEVCQVLPGSFTLLNVNYQSWKREPTFLHHYKDLTKHLFCCSNHSSPSQMSQIPEPLNPKFIFENKFLSLYIYGKLPGNMTKAHSSNKKTEALLFGPSDSSKPQVDLDSLYQYLLVRLDCSLKCDTQVINLRLYCTLCWSPQSQETV